MRSPATPVTPASTPVVNSPVTAQAHAAAVSSNGKATSARKKRSGPKEMSKGQIQQVAYDLEAVGRMGVKHEGAFRMVNPVGPGIKRHSPRTTLFGRNMFVVVHRYPCTHAQASTATEE